MSQFVPDIITYGKIASQIEDLKTRLVEEGTSINSYQDLAAEFEQTISNIINTGQLPVVEYERFFTGEPPSREKMNRILDKLEKDFALIEKQGTVTRAAAIFQFNHLETEIKKNVYLNAQARDRLGVLQLYTNAPDANTINFGSNLTNDAEFDKRIMEQGKYPSLAAPGNLTLGATNKAVDLMQNASIRILSGSNGFLGNNQELVNAVNEIPPPAVGEEGDDSNEDSGVSPTDYVFKQNLFNPKYLEATLDGEANTWVEFEVYELANSAKMAAGNLNFEYKESESGATRKFGTRTIDSYGYLNNTEIPWASGPFGGDILKLNLEYDLGGVYRPNTIKLSYHGLDNNVNEPYKISRVDVSEDGSEWETLRQKDVWIASDASKATARVAPNVSIGSAMWIFPDRDIRYVRFYIEQPEAIPVVLGHLYYETRKKQTITYTETHDSLSPNGIRVVRSEEVSGGERTEGPNPPVDATDKHFGPIGGLLSNDIVRRIEQFNGKRWAIGIRDVDVRHWEYAVKSSFFTKTYRIDGIIDRVTLEADYYIPEEFTSDEQWVKFFVSPNDGLDWFSISRIQDDYFGIPEIIAFNDPIPVDYRDPNVGYYELDTTANSIKLKVELSRPAEHEGKTPILKSYNIKVQKR